MADRIPPRPTVRPQEKVTASEMIEVQRKFRPLPESPSIDQIIHAYHEMGTAYANIAFGCSVSLKNHDKSIEELRAEAVVTGAIARRADEGVVLLGYRVETLETKVAKLIDPASLVHGLPPMRQKLDSNLDERVEAVSSTVAKNIDDEMKNPATPSPDKDRFKELVADGVKIELLRIKAENWERIETERKTAETERLAFEKRAADDAATLKKKADENVLELQLTADRQKLALAAEKVRVRNATIAGLITTAAGVIAFLIERFGHK